MSEINNKRYEVYNISTGEFRLIEGLAKFCRDVGLNESCLRDVSKGRQHQHRSWRVREYGELKDLFRVFVSIKKRPQAHSKQKRYKQPIKRVWLYNHTQFIHQYYHIDRNLTCGKISEIFHSDAESVRTLFHKHGLVVNNNVVISKGASHYTYETLTPAQKDFINGFVQNFTHLHKIGGRSVSSISDELGISRTTIFNYCRKYEVEYKKPNISTPHRILSEWLSELDFRHINNTRSVIKPKELDIVIGDLNLAIEINGLYYHNSSRIPKEYHLNKIDLCEGDGLSLLHVWDVDVIYRRTAIQSEILRRAGLLKDVRLYQEDIRYIPKKLGLEFINSNCLSRFRGTPSFYLGSLVHGELVSVVSVGLEGDQTMVLSHAKKSGIESSNSARAFVHHLTNEGYKNVRIRADRGTFDSKCYSDFEILEIKEPHLYSWEGKNHDIFDEFVEGHKYVVYDSGAYILMLKKKG